MSIETWLHVRAMNVLREGSEQHEQLTTEHIVAMASWQICFIHFFFLGNSTIFLTRPSTCSSGMADRRPDRASTKMKNV